jgi:hypothetical protein
VKKSGWMIHPSVLRLKLFGGKVINGAGSVKSILFLYIKPLSKVNSLYDMRIRSAVMFDMTYTFDV